MLKKCVAAGVVIAFTESAMGHEGHGVHGQGNTVAHYVLDPWHLPLMILICIAAVGIAAVAWRMLLASKSDARSVRHVGHS